MKVIKKISKWFWETNSIMHIILICVYSIIAGRITNAILYSAFPIMALVAYILLLSFAVIVLLMGIKIEEEEE